MADGEVQDLAMEPVASAAMVSRPATRDEAKALQAFGGESYALADLSGAQFDALVARMKLHDERMNTVKESMMVYGVHYGVPGKSKDKVKPGEKHGIYKSGVELLLSLFGLVADVKTETIYGDPENKTSPALIVNARSEIHRGSLDGPIVAVGVASRNSWEVKYRWRKVGRVCPKCGAASIMVSKFEADRGPFKGTTPWWCNTKADGCGAQFAPNDPEIVEQVTDKISNPDAYDLALTLTKMAAKAARADGTITATRSSNLWTQDLEDISRQAVVNEADVEATVEGMYGQDPDAWRGGAEDEKPKPAAPATTANGITEKQKTYIGQLAAKKIPGGAANLDAWLADNRKPSLAELTSHAAGVVIEALKGLPDAAADSAPKTKSTKDVQARVRDLLIEVEGREKRKTFELREGVTYVCGEDELEHMQYVEPFSLSSLSPAMLISLGSFLKARLESAAAA